MKLFLKSLTLLLSIFMLNMPAHAEIVTKDQLIQAVLNSPNATPWIKSNAAAIGNLAFNMENKMGDTTNYNGSCCSGILQMNQRNVRVFAGMSPAQYRQASLQTQVDAWTKYMADGLTHAGPRKMASLTTFAGRPVDANLVMACVQLGSGDCMTNIRANRCDATMDKNGTDICKMADAMGRNGGSTSGIGSSIDSGSDGLFSSDPDRIDGSGIIDNILGKYAEVVEGWETEIKKRAEYLFWTLVVISMVWTFGMLALRKADIGEFFAEFIRFTVFTGFFWWLLQNGPGMTEDIILSLREIGGQAGGHRHLSPSKITDIGFKILDASLKEASVLSPRTSLIAIIMASIILVLLTLVAINMAVLLVSGWVLAYAGIFFLGFGGSKWTSDIALNFYKTVLSLGAQLLTIALIVGVGQAFADEYLASLSNGFVATEMAVMVVVASVLYILATKLPPMIGGLATGNLGAAGIGNFGAQHAVGAIAAGIAVATTAGAVAAAGARGLAGGAAALNAAFSSSGQQEDSSTKAT